jgi:membrane protease YdiL (CAAX protease family)
MNNPDENATVPPPILVPGADGLATASRTRWWIHLVLVGAYPLVVGLIGWGRNSSSQPALGHGAKGLLLVCVLELLVFGVVFLLAWLASRATRDALLLRWRSGFWTIPIGIGYSVALRLALGVVVAVVAVSLLVLHVTTLNGLRDFFTANRPDVESLVDVAALRDNPLYYWLTLTLVSFGLGGLREEIWRSGFMAGMAALWPRRFGSRGGQLVAAGVGAVIFGLGHLTQGPLAVCLTGLLGFGLGAIIVAHRSIWPAVIAHGLFDATSLAALPWAADMLKQISH